MQCCLKCTITTNDLLGNEAMHCEDSSDLIAHMKTYTHIQHLCRVIEPFIELVPITLICDHADVVGDHKSCDDRGD